MSASCAGRAPADVYFPTTAIVSPLYMTEDGASTDIAVVGNDGVVMCHVTQSPLKMLHWLAGPQNATYFIMDHPEETRELARIHEEKALKLLEQVVDLPETEKAAVECLSLPVHPSLNEADLERVVTAVNALANAGA